MPEILDVFSFFHTTHFPSGKGRLSCAATPYRLEHVLQSSSTSIIICKTFFVKCWVILENRKTCCFPLPGKSGKGSKIFGKDDGDLWRYWCRIRILFKMLTVYYRQLDLTLEVFRSIRISKMSTFVNVDLDQHFLLQELNEQTYCDQFGGN